MLLKMLGALVLVRMGSWLLTWLLHMSGRKGNMLAVHILTVAGLIGLEMAVRMPLGVFSQDQIVVFIPAGLIWLSVDLIMRKTTRARR